MDAIEWGLVAGIFSIGGLVGALAGGYSCKKLGRRATIIYKNVFLIVGALIMAFSINKEVLTVGRFVVGIGAGVCTAAVPMYVAEISPVRFRGTFGALHQLGVVIAILVSMLMGLGLSNIPGWRILLGFSIVPSVLQLLLAPFTCESPRYLISVGKQIKARISLERIRGTTDVEEELYSLTASQENDSSSQEKINIIQLFQKKSLRKPLIIAIVAQIAQQLSGINGVIMFSSSIFEKLMGEGEAQSQLLTVFVGLVNLVVTILSVYLMDRAGRRALLLFSQYGMAILSILIVVGSLLNVDALIALCVISFVAVFAIGLGKFKVRDFN
jgi:sugar porter (SP) family MFS transporter